MANGGPMRRGRLRLLAAVAAATLLGAAVASPGASARHKPHGRTASFKFADIVRVAPSMLMVVGRPLDVAKGQADVGNAILYRRGNTLYMIDTGATTAFRRSLLTAINRLRPFKNVVLINSH